MQPWLLFIVFYEERQILSPVVFKASGQVRVNVIFRKGSIKVCMKISRILCRWEMGSDTPAYAKETVFIANCNFL